MKCLWIHAIALVAGCLMIACSGGSSPHPFIDAGAGFGGASGSAGIGGISGVGGFGAVGGTGGSTATCGNRRIEAGELCDDGNTLDDDYCRADCQANTGSCGDTRVQSRVESCDPGNSDSPGCFQCAIEANSRCEGEPSLCGPPTLNWDAPLTSYARQDAEAYCTWLGNAQFGSASRVECPGFLTAIRLSLSECADNFASFADTCVGSLGQVLECLRGTDVCDAVTAGPTNDAINRCVSAACRSVCTRGTWSCNGNTARHCNEWGNGYEETDCGVGTCSTAFQGSNDPNEVCGLTICESNTWSCNGNTARLCATDRLSYAQQVDCGTSFCVSGGRISTPMNQVCDVNECLNGTHNCNANATCTNVPGSFMCTCNGGYAGDGVTCTDIDECALGTDNCDTNATCANTVGSFMCMCNGDYNGSGTTCLRDECALNLHNCDVNAHCIDTALSFTCACNSGYAGNGVTCSDINECAGNHTCDTSPSACINDIGSHHCMCPDGYEGNGVGSSGCLDINECMTGDYTCDPNAGCINTAGSYTCMCNAGYGGDAVSCTPYATLTSLVPSAGTLAPAFDPQITSYTLAIPLAVSTISFTATSDTADTLMVDGQSEALGTLSTARSHPLGTSASTVQIAGPGVLARTYTINVTRAAYTYIKPSIATDGASFGTALDLSGTTLIVGAPDTPSASGGYAAGAVYFFDRAGGSWALRTSFRATTASGLLGNAVAIDGDTAVASHGQQAEVYVRSGNTWVHQASIPSRVDMYSSMRVTISGDTIVLSDPGDRSTATGINGDPNTRTAAQNSGAVRVFRRTGDVWAQEAYIKASNTGFSDGFGRALDLEDDLLVVGAPGEWSAALGINGDQLDDSDNGAGAIYVFQRSGSTWTQEAYVKAAVAGSRFGSAISVDSGRFATLQGQGITERILLFERSGGAWTTPLLLPPISSVLSSWSNLSIDLSGNHIVVGYQWEHTASRGVDGNERAQPDTSNAGAGYLFELGGSGWTRIHYLKASNPGADDHFGFAVAIDGFIAIGAPYEDSGATTINGNQSDNSQNARGAVYVF